MYSRQSARRFAPDFPVITTSNRWHAPFLPDVCHATTSKHRVVGASSLRSAPFSTPQSLSSHTYKKLAHWGPARGQARTHQHRCVQKEQRSKGVAMASRSERRTIQGGVAGHFEWITSPPSPRQAASGPRPCSGPRFPTGVSPPTSAGQYPESANQHPAEISLGSGM